MSRQLKFRVYIPDHEKFTHFQLGDFDYSDRYLHQHEYPVQQFIGVCDKNGKEIYEGDLVNFSEEDKPFEVRYCVDSEGTYYGLIDPKDDTWGYKLSTDNEYQVVGNIFELPCKPDHNGECMVCDCWLSDCPLRK